MKFKPKVITGSPTYLRLFAEKVLSSGKDPPRLRTLVTGGEPLDEPTRDLLENTFDCKTYNSYGAFDLGYIAMECTEKNGLHVMADSLFMEVVKDGEPVSPGERGELVVTGLSNEAMPMIRYKLGDIGILSDEMCSCGRNFPLLKSMEGRSLDHVATDSGAVLSPKMVLTLMHSVRKLPRSQLVEENSGSFTLRVFDQGQENIETSVQEFLKKLRDISKDKMEVNVSIEKTDQVKAKFRPLLSKQSSNIDTRWVHPTNKDA